MIIYWGMILCSLLIAVWFWVLRGAGFEGGRYGGGSDITDIIILIIVPTVMIGAVWLSIRDTIDYRRRKKLEDIRIANGEKIPLEDRVSKREYHKTPNKDPKPFWISLIISMVLVGGGILYGALSPDGRTERMLERMERDLIENLENSEETNQ